MLKVTMWKSRETARTILSNTSDLASLDGAFALSQFWRTAIYPEGYMAHASWTELVVLQVSANPWLNALRMTKHGIPNSDAYLGAFCRFFYHDLMVDWSKSDLDGIRNLLNREIREERIRFPFRFGRLLYDRFNDTDTHGRTEHLDHSEVISLVAGTPQGVYQVHRFVSGPLGLLESRETRYIPPSLSVPLWHCSDTGCKALHSVDFRQNGVLWLDAYAGAMHLMANEFGPISEWFRLLAFRVHDERWSTGREYYDLPVLLADCVVGKERTALLSRAIRSPDGQFIQNALLSSTEGQRNRGRSPEDLAASVPAESQLQLLLLLSDRDLVRLVDESVADRAIRIPLGETRSSKSSPPAGFRDADSCLSSMGLQSCHTPALVNLVSLILRAYAINDLCTDLAWKIRATTSAPIAQSLIQYVREKEPEDLVRILILSSQTVTNYICEDRQIVFDPDAPTEQFVARLLWKCGFNPPQFGEFERRFLNRLREFNDVLLSNTPVAVEDQREYIRRAGVNMFVSVEGFLENILVYNVWLLSSDHFVETRFRFNVHTARSKVAAVLGASLDSDGAVMTWSENGDNTLGVCLRYLGEAVKWMTSIIESTDHDGLLRPEADLPHYARDRRFTFPFRHKSFWADCDLAGFRRYADEFAKVVKLLAQSNLASVRNGLDHMRPEASFPSGDTMFACVARLREAFDVADVMRLYPKIFWLYKHIKYQSGTSEFDVRDYAGRTTRFFGPDLAIGHPAIEFDKPFLICPGGLLSVPNAEICFRFANWDEYTRYWQGYPRRRHIPIGDQREPPDDGPSPNPGSQDGSVVASTPSIIS
jgi:hypothetical protein